MALILDSTTKKLQIVLAGAKTTLDANWSASWEDTPNVGGPYAGLSGGQAHGATNGATAVDLVPAPGAGVTRRLTSLWLNNSDTGTITLSIQIVDSSGPTTRVVWKGTRATLEQLSYENGAGFQAFSVALARQ